MRRFRPPQKNPQKTLVIVMIAACLMVLADRFGREGVRPETPAPPPAEAVAKSEIRDFAAAQSVVDRMQSSQSLMDEVFLYVPQPEPVINRLPREEPLPVAVPPAPVKETVSPGKNRGPGKIVIIIDDLGMDRRRSSAIIDMDAPLTLALLPYASGVREMATKARGQGHELLIHAPMEPLDPALDPGPLALLEKMSDEELRGALERMFSAFEGYVGINNHMGSRLTQNRHAMDLVMEELARRELVFVDSKTIGTSVAGDSAAAHGLGYAERNVFLDNQDSADFVENALAETEHIARRRGFAVAIGHPRDATIAALRQWLPTLKERGLEVVPVSAIMESRKNSGPAVTVSAPAPAPPLPPQ
jgi:uncharacterized protein